MIRDTSPALRPAHAPALDVPIRVRRDRQSLEIDRAELMIDEHGRFGPDPVVTTPQVRWSLDGSLLPDEVVLIFGRSLDWTGPWSRLARDLPLIEDVFPHPYSLSQHRPIVLSGAPRIRFPRGQKTVGWSFGAILVRGDDSPWVGGSVLRLTRTRT